MDVDATHISTCNATMQASPRPASGVGDPGRGIRASHYLTSGFPCATGTRQGGRPGAEASLDESRWFDLCFSHHVVGRKTNEQPVNK